MIDSDGNLLEINYYDDLNDFNNTKVKTISEDASEIEVNPQTYMAYTIKEFSNTISVIDLYLNKIVTNIEVGKYSIIYQSIP